MTYLRKELQDTVYANIIAQIRAAAAEGKTEIDIRLPQKNHAINLVEENLKVNPYPTDSDYGDFISMTVSWKDND